MERKTNENEIIVERKNQLKEITLRDLKDTIVVKAKYGDEIGPLSKKGCEKFGFKYCDPIQIEHGCSCDHKNSIAICIGTGNGCPDDPNREELWFLAEENWVFHFCGNKKEDFDELETGGKLLRL